MATSINFRSDLAQLSDVEIAERLESEWLNYEAANSRRSWWGVLSPGMFHLKRGPIRHPRAYRFLAALSAGGGSWLDGLFAIAFSHKGAERWLRGADPAADTHLSICEIQDLLEEVERRVAERKVTAS